MNLSMHCPCNIKADKSTQGPYFLSSHPSWKWDFEVWRAASGASDISVIAHLSERSKSSRSLRGRVCNPASSQSNYSDQPAKVNLNLTRNACSVFLKFQAMLVLYFQSCTKCSFHILKVGWDAHVIFLKLYIKGRYLPEVQHPHRPHPGLREIHEKATTNRLTQQILLWPFSMHEQPINDLNFMLCLLHLQMESVGVNFSEMLEMRRLAHEAQEQSYR